jgi:phasin family protein
MTTESNAWYESSKQALHNAKALGEINYGITNRLMQQQMEMLGIYLESGVQQLRAMSEAQDVKALLNQEAALVDEAGKKVLSNMQGTLDVMEGAKGQWVEWAENSVASLQKAA